MFRFNKSQRTPCGVPCNPIQELACRCLGAAQWMNPLMTNLVCLPCLHIQPGIVYLGPLLLLLSLQFCSPKQHLTFIVLLAFFQIFQAGGTVAQFAQGHPILIHNIRNLQVAAKLGGLIMIPVLYRNNGVCAGHFFLPEAAKVRMRHRVGNLLVDVDPGSMQLHVARH